MGKIIPGVSGSMLAISLGIYQELIESINNIFKFSKLNIKFLIKVFIGILISIIFFSGIISQLLNKKYFITMLFFVGLIIGGLSDIKKNIDITNNKITIICFLIVTLFGVISINNEFTTNNYLLSFIYFVFIGIVDAITTIVPGISGTATLMMLGGYTPIINSFSTILNANHLNQNSLILIPFFIGFGIGILFTAKLIQYLFKKHKSSTYSCILGFSFATILLMILKSFTSNYTFSDLIIGLMCLIIGIIITKKITHSFSE